MSEFAEMGVKIRQVNEVKTITTPDDVDEARAFTVFTLTLPSRPKVQATFTSESLRKKISKLFKSEIQTGDSRFDDEVFVKTDTRSETAAFLQSDDVKDTIVDAVRSGGSVEIQDSMCVLRMPGANASDSAIVRFVQALIG
jgi:hypothetical protein